jgi:hypothetical protein
MSCDCEYPKFFTSKIRKARKTHKCDECSRLINIGDEYEYVSGKWDDFIGSYKTCFECSDVRTWLKKRIDCCVAFGELRTELIESEIISDDYDKFCYVMSYTDEIEMIDGFVRLKNATKR